ncbi:MAG: hypothetical protein VXW22_14370 [Pseudomonadota bacterium]|nr:hypothetical protein [Pseudomonadota bacterium]
MTANRNWKPPAIKSAFFDGEVTANSAKRIDVESGEVIATICAWQSEDVEFDAVQTATGNTIFVEPALEAMPFLEKLDYYLSFVLARSR